MTLKIDSLAEFVRGDVDIATGRISKRSALLQIAATPIIVAVGATIFCAMAVLTPRPNAFAAIAAANAQTAGPQSNFSLQSVNVELPERQPFPRGRKGGCNQQQLSRLPFCGNDFDPATPVSIPVAG